MTDNTEFREDNTEFREDNTEFREDNTEFIEDIKHTNTEINIKNSLFKLMNEYHIEGSAHDKLYNNIIYYPRQGLSQILSLNFLYNKIINLHGNIFEFGCRYGAKTTTFFNLKKIYEPYNYNRKIIAFDTFNGFCEIDNKDNTCQNQLLLTENNYSTTKNYENHLTNVMEAHQMNSPNSHIDQFEIIKGDASIKINEWLENNKHALASLVYFDMDVYKPTKECLNKILQICSKGTILCFDELNHQSWPGETLAVLEELNIKNYKIERCPFLMNMGFIEL